MATEVTEQTIQHFVRRVFLETPGMDRVITLYLLHLAQNKAVDIAYEMNLLTQKDEK